MRPPCLIHLSVIEQNTRCQVFYIGTDTYDATINPNRSHVQHEQRQVFYIGTATYDATINPNRSHVQHEQQQWCSTVQRKQAAGRTVRSSTAGQQQGSGCFNSKSGCHALLTIKSGLTPIWGRHWPGPLAVELNCFRWKID